MKPYSFFLAMFVMVLCVVSISANIIKPFSTIPGKVVAIEIVLTVSPALSGETLKWNEDVVNVFSTARGPPFAYNIKIFLSSAGAVPSGDIIYEFINFSKISFTTFWHADNDAALQKFINYINQSGTDPLLFVLNKSVEGYNHYFSQLDVSGRYYPDTARNGVKDSDETAIDCGGKHAPRCYQKIGVHVKAGSVNTIVVNDEQEDPIDYASCQSDNDCVTFTSCITLDTFTDRFGADTIYTGETDVYGNTKVCSWYDYNIPIRERSENNSFTLGAMAAVGVAILASMIF